MPPLYPLNLSLAADIEPAAKDTHSPPPQAAGQPERFSRMLPLRQMPPVALVLGMGVCQEARPQEHRMLAIFLAQRVDTLIKIREPLQPDHFAKQIELAVRG